MIHLPSLRDFTRDTAQALGILAAVAAVTDWATENKRLRAHCAALEDANTQLRRERDVLEKHANRLLDANRDLAAAVLEQGKTIHEMVTLDDDDDAEGYEPAAPTFGPAFIAEQVAEFRTEIEAWGGESA